MLNLTSAALKVFLALDPCDMCKSFNGLHTLAADQLLTAPARDALFVFTNKRLNRIKLLYFDGTEHRCRILEPRWVMTPDNPEQIPDRRQSQY